RFGQERRQLLFDFLGSAAERGEPGAAASRASCPRRLVVPAEMALEPLAAETVQHQRDRTVWTAHRRAARGADQRTGMAAPVEEEDGLLAAGQRRAQRGSQ